jgi:oligopeptidase B
MGLSRSRKFILLNIEEERTSEFRYLPADHPTGELKVIEPRQRGIIYDVDHVGDEFFIRTNLDAPDFRLMRAPQATPAAAHWNEIVPEKAGHHLSHFKVFETLVAVDLEDESGTMIRVFDLPELREIQVPRPANRGRLKLLRGRERSQSRSGSKGPAFSFQQSTAAAMRL